MAAEDVASANVAAWTAVGEATGQPQSCPRGHGGAGRPHGMSPWTWPLGRLWGMPLPPWPWPWPQPWGEVEGESWAAAGDGHGTATVDVASVEVAARDGRGHVVADEARGGKQWKPATTDEAV